MTAVTKRLAISTGVGLLMLSLYKACEPTGIWTGAYHSGKILQNAVMWINGVAWFAAFFASGYLHYEWLYDGPINLVDVAVFIQWFLVSYLLTLMLVRSNPR